MEPACSKKIIFDLDGVITAEECYWDAAALAVWELLFSGRYLGLEAEKSGLPAFKTALTADEIALIRRVIFQHEKVITFFKQKGVNSNWDLAFLTFAYQLALIGKELSLRGVLNAVRLDNEEGIALADLKRLASFLVSLHSFWKPSFEAVLSDWTGDARGTALAERLFSCQDGLQAVNARTKAFKPFSSLWQGVRDVFQEWYLGEKKYREVYGRDPAEKGKKGLIYNEKPLLPAKEVVETLSCLQQGEWILGIATGRPFNELYTPLQRAGIWEFFDRGSIVCFDDVQKAEESLQGELKKISLAKPHPFPFLRAYWGEMFSYRELSSPHFPKPQPGKCWIVGDSMADLLAAKKMGAFFLGVLTGHNGEEAKSLFMREGARAVLQDITALPRYFAKNV